MREREEDKLTARVMGLLAAVAVPFLLFGMLGLNGRLMMIGVAVAIAGIIFRLARL